MQRDGQQQKMLPISQCRCIKPENGRVSTILKEESLSYGRRALLNGGTIHTKFSCIFYHCASMIIYKIFSSDLVESQDPCQASKKSKICQKSEISHPSLKYSNSTNGLVSNMYIMSVFTKNILCLIIQDFL